jgi:hypothetical protein
MSLNYDKTTFGRTPAAMYLTLKLNEKGDPILARKVGKVLRETRELLYDVAACHMYTDEMKRASFCKLLNMIRERAKASTANLRDEFIAHLVLNVLIGEIRTHERRAIRAAHVQKSVTRATKEGQTVPEIKATPVRGEETEEERIANLQQKSRRYLLRKGKINTLY